MTKHSKVTQYVMLIVFAIATGAAYGTIYVMRLEQADIIKPVGVLSLYTVFAMCFMAIVGYMSRGK